MEVGLRLLPGADRPYSFSIPALRTAAPHFFDSACWNAASSSGEARKTAVPLLAWKALFSAGLFAALPSSSLSLATTGAGVLAGA